MAHGSADPRASATVAALAAMARERSPGLDLRPAFLGHAPPSLPQVLGTIEADREVTVLPLLLTAAYHSKADIPRMLARLPQPRVTYGDTLGPHPLLLDALDRRLAEALPILGPGAHRDPERTAVVLAAAGSSDQEANATIARLAVRRGRVKRAGRTGQRWIPHSVLPVPVHRPLRGSAPGSTRAVQVAQPMDG